MYKKVKKYFEKHIYFNSFVHVLIGIGIGIWANPFTGIHPLRWAGVLIVLGILGHIYPAFVKK
ncbi:MAG: DUF423 domain-containing protein [Patescibacteria group bacterium]|nr:DUF423 domain-containing protein [Patescibacteria group bacterium]